MVDTNIDAAKAESADLKRYVKTSSLITLKKILPYLWPQDKLWVKRRVVIALLALFIAKLVSVITPIFYKYAVDQLAGTETDAQWLLVLGAVGLTIAYGLARLTRVLFQELRDFVFARVGQRALRELALETIKHIHQLSMRYHISRKTGGLSRVMERGVKGIDFLLRYLLFDIAPLVIELVLISIVLVVAFDFWYLAIVAAAVILYIGFTAVITEWRVKIRKQMNDKDKAANQKAIDSLLNYETVKYFGAEEREAQRYDESMAGFEAASLKTIKSLSLLNIGQAVIINTGMVVAMVMAAIEVKSGKLSVGDFVMINAYMMQVMMPLDYLGYVYREIRQALIDMGEMFTLLEQPAEINDVTDAKDLVVSGAEVRFKQAYFAYDSDRPILQGIDFKVAAGSMVAFVGASGSGKSTIGRLLFRFYDLNQGEILIDGQNIKHITQQSLHRAIGVVPQDTVLFNDSIYYNIAYAKPNASREEVEQAARQAQVHDFIMSLPAGYETTVGERGLKLSGGEKQRVGIARTMLKNPPILLLDEATSALDTETEQEIQASLEQMSRGRTVFTIAHRLSTIVNADQIIVLGDGKILEQGRHDELICADGRYATMWKKQLAGDFESSFSPCRNSEAD